MKTLRLFSAALLLALAAQADETTVRIGFVPPSDEMELRVEDLHKDVDALTNVSVTQRMEALLIFGEWHRAGGWKIGEAIGPVRIDYGFASPRNSNQIMWQRMPNGDFLTPLELGRLQIHRSSDR